MISIKQIKDIKIKINWEIKIKVKIQLNHSKINLNQAYMIEATKKFLALSTQNHCCSALV